MDKVIIAKIEGNIIILFVYLFIYLLIQTSLKKATNYKSRKYYINIRQ